MITGRNVDMNEEYFSDSIGEILKDSLPSDTIEFTGHAYEWDEIIHTIQKENERQKFNCSTIRAGLNSPSIVEQQNFVQLFNSSAPLPVELL